MKKIIFSLFFALIGVGTLTTSCEDMLTPEMDRYTENFSGKDTVNFYFGILRNLQGMVEQNVLLGELRGDLVSPTEYVADSINDLLNFTNLVDGDNALLNRAAYYKVINQCNFYLARVDSMAIKNNNYYMRREMAQVQLIRAWTYMQLVQNYGKVPFIVKPVNHSETGWETHPEDWATPDNLLELLESKGGLKQAYAYSQTLGYPNYGKLNTGAGEAQHKLMVFNANLVYGDLYLLRGASQNDYMRAAEYYHAYLSKDCEDFVSGEASAFRVIYNGEEKYYAMATPWASSVVNSGLASPGEFRTIVPAASNSFFGTVLTRIPQIYGFDATSKNETTSEIVKDDKNKEQEKVSSSGKITLKANYRNRQVEPSPALDQLSKNQVFVCNVVELGKQTDVKYLKIGDQRLYAATALVQTEAGRLRFIQKFGSSSSVTHRTVVRPDAFNFRYGVPLYRTRQVYLRYAEALNRAGFPRYAFAVLRDGLSSYSLPTLSTSIVRDTTYTDATKTDIASIRTTFILRADSTLNGANNIDYTSLVRAQNVPFLDFSLFTNKENYGLREAGSCTSETSTRVLHGFTDVDTVWTYEKVVAQRMVDEAARQGKTLALPDLKPSTQTTTTQGKTEEVLINGKKVPLTSFIEAPIPTLPTAEEISAVETLIADEMALETAFEGYRFYDLMRLARHRNAAGEDGSAWMAWLISRRGENLAPYEQPTRTGSLYNFLLNPANWYLPAPANK